MLKLGEVDFMGVLFWFIIALIAFVFITIIRKWHDYAMLYTIAIGFAINANIYNALNVPINCGPFILSIDSILYTGFMFCVTICANEYGVRKAKILTSSSIAAILLSAVIEQLAYISSTGFKTEYLLNFGGYFASAVGTFAGVWLMLFVFEKLSQKSFNVYLNIGLAILIASIVNSSIYYGFTLCVSGPVQNLGAMLAGSYLGKIICIILCAGSFYLNTHIIIPNDLKSKYQNKNSSLNKNE